MKSLGLAVFFVVVAAASAGLHAGWVGPGVIAGPAGATIITSGVAPGIIAPGHLGAGAIIAPGLLGHGLIGSGIEGQWIPDINEKLYDDGSYKPWIYGH